MDHYSKHKSLYLLNRFINSEIFFELEITPYDITILYLIGRYLDMPSGFCMLKQANFAKECRMSLRQFKLRTEYLFKNKIIFRYYSKKLYCYEYGEILTGFPNK